MSIQISIKTILKAGFQKVCEQTLKRFFKPETTSAYKHTFANHSLFNNCFEFILLLLGMIQKEDFFNFYSFCYKL